MLFQTVELQEYRHIYLREGLLCLHEITAGFLIFFFIFLSIKDILVSTWRRGVSLNIVNTAIREAFR